MISIVVQKILNSVGKEAKISITRFFYRKPDSRPDRKNFLIYSHI